MRSSFSSPELEQSYTQLQQALVRIEKEIQNVNMILHKLGSTDKDLQYTFIQYMALLRAELEKRLQKVHMDEWKRKLDTK